MFSAKFLFKQRNKNTATVQKRYKSKLLSTTVFPTISKLYDIINMSFDIDLTSK